MVCVNIITKNEYINRYFFENMFFSSPPHDEESGGAEREPKLKLNLSETFHFYFPASIVFPAIQLKLNLSETFLVPASSVPKPIIQNFLNQCKNWNRWNTLLQMIFTPCDQQKSDFWSQLSNYFTWFLMVLKTLMFICLICHQVEWFWDLFLKWVAQRGYCCWKKSSFHKKLYSKNSADEREIFVRSGNSPPFPNERSEFCVFVQNSHICRF